MPNDRVVVSVDFSAPARETASALLRAAFPDRVDLWEQTSEPLLLLTRFDDEIWGVVHRVLKAADFSEETKTAIWHHVRLEAWRQIADIFAPNRVSVVAAPSEGEKRSFDD